MINFKQYPNVTKIVIPNNVELTNNNFAGKFQNLENLETIVKESKSKAEVLRKLGLAAKGGNYSNLDR